MEVAVRSDDVPTYAELPMFPNGLRHAWDVFGRDDDLGTANFLTPQVVHASTTEIRTGERVGVTLPLSSPNPPFWGRAPYRHTILDTAPLVQDDVIDNFHLQGSTQWDGLRHRRDPEHGFYGGVTRAEAGPSGRRLGADAWAREGIVGRAVLADVERWLRATDADYDPTTRFVIPADLLAEVLAHQRVTLLAGDILLVRTGYVEAFLRLPVAEQAAVRTAGASAGLAPDDELAGFLWDNRIAAVAVDNPAVEVLPRDPDEPFLHSRLIPMLGMVMGEFFDFQKLGERCHEDGRYTGFFVSVPLNIPGAVGTPGNAVVIR